MTGAGVPDRRQDQRALGPCTECGTPRDACDGPDWCCEECLHLDADWEGYEQPAAAPVPGQQREAVARWLFESQHVMRSLCSPEDAEWDEWVERNREEWREQADELLALLAATRDGGRA